MLYVYINVYVHEMRMASQFAWNNLEKWEVTGLFIGFSCLHRKQWLSFCNVSTFLIVIFDLFLIEFYFYSNKSNVRITWYHDADVHHYNVVFGVRTGTPPVMTQTWTLKLPKIFSHFVKKSLLNKAWGKFIYSLTSIQRTLL